jgi:predicted PurR-regulated permease PerM
MMGGFISALADVAIIWLVLISFILCLIPLAIFGGIVYGLHKVLNALPPVFDKAQQTMEKVTEGADRATDKVAAPLIAASAFSTRVRATVGSLTNLIRREA